MRKNRDEDVHQQAAKYNLIAIVATLVMWLSGQNHTFKFSTLSK